MFSVLVWTTRRGHCKTGKKLSDDRFKKPGKKTQVLQKLYPFFAGDFTSCFSKFFSLHWARLLASRSETSSYNWRQRHETFIGCTTQQLQLATMSFVCDCVHWRFRFFIFPRPFWAKTNMLQQELEAYTIGSAAEATFPINGQTEHLTWLL